MVDKEDKMYTYLLKFIRFFIFSNIFLMQLKRIDVPTYLPLSETMI